MTWNIAHAKQQFSEVVRLAAHAPQPIFNRDKPVAVLVSPSEFEQFTQWRAQQSALSLLDSLAPLRAALLESGQDGIDVGTRTDRPNPVLALADF